MKKELLKIEDRMTGSTSRLRELYRAAFSDTESERLITETKKQNRMIALLVAFVFICALIAGVSGLAAKNESAFDLTRPGTGENPKTIKAEIEAEYDGYVTNRETELRILPREPSAEEAESLLADLKQRLPYAILGDNVSADAVTGNLFLPVVDDETGAEISWNTSDPRIISRDGAVNLVGVETGTVVTLTATIRLASATETLRVVVKTSDAIPPEQIGISLKERLDEIIKAVENSQDGTALSLPEATEDGVTLAWRQPEQGGDFLALFVCILIAFICFNLRFRYASRKIEAARLEIERDFPEFIQKLGLLLGAGMVITSAIRRITEDYEKTCEIYGRKRLYDELVSLSERMSAAGTPLIYEFAELARRSGLRELMRFSSILADNIDKGSTLAEKLRIESEMLWEGRKKRAEKEGRIAETKMIFPMALQIFAVIAITVMPAAFEMG